MTVTTDGASPGEVDAAARIPTFAVEPNCKREFSSSFARWWVVEVWMTNESGTLAFERRRFAAGFGDSWR